jgi:two-component system phosphate regulon sensor histidine kinase PhoR
MIWPILAILALATLIIVHLSWRFRFARTRQSLQAHIDRLTAREQRRMIEIQSQQEALLNSMAEGLLVIDKHSRIQLANRTFSKLIDVSDDIRGKTILEAIRLHELRSLVEKLSQQGKPLSEEIRLPGPGERWVEVNAAPIAAQDGSNSGAVLVFHDLTRLRELERTREEFVANVSHELRTPLSLIKGYVETLLDGAKNDPQTAERFLQTIYRNSERLRLLIEDLLAISELESGKVRLDLRWIALPSLVEKVFAELRSKLNSTHIQLINSMPGLTVRADAARLEQVFFNLLDNAVKYGGAEGTIEAGVRSVGEKDVEIFIRDNGPGIPPEALDRVFERFFRVDKARSREKGGTGLGLSIVKHIVQSHGGRVWVESTVGKGATFFFTLPPGEPGQT